MATYQLTKPKAKTVVTMPFNSYNEAIAFFNQSKLLQPSKPFKRILMNGSDAKPVWCVSIANKAVNTGKKWRKLESVPQTATNRKVKRVYEDITAAVEFALDFGRWMPEKDECHVH